jgi:TRAP-type C4-dicarboxylate transport system substrate-binding protein
MRRRLLLSALPAFALARRAAAEPVKLELFCYYPHTTLPERAAQTFADEAGRRSAGSVLVSVETGLATIPFSNISKATALAIYYAPDHAKFELLFRLSALPMLAQTFDEAETLLRIAQPYYAAALARHGQVLLATQPWRPAALWSILPLRSGADFKGAAFGQWQTAYTVEELPRWATPFIRLGAHKEGYNDAEIVLNSGADPLRFTQEFAYLTEIFFAAQLSFLTVNRDVFEALPTEQRYALVEAARETERSEWALQRELVLQEHRDVEKLGVKVIAQPPGTLLDALREAAEPDIRAWADSVGVEGNAILAEYRRAIGRG